MTCSISDCENPAERSGKCATHARLERKAVTEATKPKPAPKRIKPRSEKMTATMTEYNRMKKDWIKGKQCAVFPDKPAQDIHHMKGRSSLDLILDVTYWLPVSREGHIKIENNPKWAKEQGFSLERLQTEPHKI